MYVSNPDDPDDVAAIVTRNAGRMDGGDIKWTFDNSVDDTNHDINEGLKSEISSYVTSVVSIQGDGEKASGGDGGDGDGGDSTDPQPSGVTRGGYVVDLINDTDSGFSIVGSTSNSKGTVNIDGKTYDTCLKMGSSSSVTFTITEPMVLTLYFANSAGKRIQINNMAEITIPENNTVTTKLPAAGEYVIRRTSGESYLYYIALSPIQTTGIDIPGSADGVFRSADRNVFNLAGQRVGKGYHGILIINGKKVIR